MITAILFILSVCSYATDLGRAAEQYRSGDSEKAYAVLEEYIAKNPAEPFANDAIIAFNLINGNANNSLAVADYLQALDDFEEGFGITALGNFLAVAEDDSAPFLLRGSAYIRLAQLSPDEEKLGYLLPAWEQDSETSIKKRAAVGLMEYYISEGDEDSAKELARDYERLYPDDMTLSYWEEEHFRK